MEHAEGALAGIMASMGQDNSAPDGWERGERVYPYFDARIESMVVKHAGEWLVSVSPQLFNDRVLLTHRDEYPLNWTAGFCYPKGPAAALAARAWDPETEPRPCGYKRVAADSRDPDPDTRTGTRTDTRTGTVPDTHPTASAAVPQERQ